jgi:5'-3' exoribonuclease 1
MTYQKQVIENLNINYLDNLYLDINGIIHKRAHNNSVIMMCRDRSREDIFYDIFTYIDELVHLIKPRELLMISADGVAPRAKMNQQRTRRFRKTEMSAKEVEALRKQGLDPDKMFNSDMISAGTEFMHELSKSFEAFVKEKMQTDSLWKSLNVIVTGADVPGEGEHKIIEYIRNFKNSNDYKEDIKHCLYGLDADLIMLSLITHEPNISILREDNTFMRKSGATDSNYRSSIKTKEPFEFIFVSILREYLELEFLEIKMKLNFEFNIERIIDDFIFFCFFIGNDFLPNLNTMDIENGALEKFYHL